MKLSSNKKIFILLICLEIIFSKMNINKTLENENYYYKAMKELKPISYLFQNSNNIKILSKVEDFIPINVPVKAKYVDGFDLYDITGLLKKSSREGNKDYIANFNSTKIIYNFKDLTKTETCNFDEKQIFEITESCRPLAGAMGKGNTWNISFDTDDRRLIKIKLNPENENYLVTYNLKCGNIKNYDIDEENSYYTYKNCVTELSLYIETSYACPKYEYFVLYAFLSNGRIFIGFILLLFTAFEILGTGDIIFYYLFSFFKQIFFIFMFIAQIFLPPQVRFWKIWLILISGFIFSFIILPCIYNKYKKKLKLKNFVKYNIGAFFGFCLGQYFYDFFVEVIFWNSIFFYLLFIFLFIIGGILLAFFSDWILIKLNSSFFGAYFFVRAILFFFNYYLSEYILVFLKINGEQGQIEQLISWKHYVYNSSIFLLTTIIFFLNFWKV